MNRICYAMIVLVTAIIPLSAQLVTPITAREPLGDVQSRAKADLQADAFVTNVFFLNIEYQGLVLSMDLQTGKADGWLYRCYSPALDSVHYYGVVEPVGGSFQIVRIPTDTLTHFLPVNVGTSELTEPWIDSPQALEVSKNGGAMPFLQAHADAQISLACVFYNPVANSAFPVGTFWYIRFVAPADTMTCTIHADTGDPYRCESSNAPKITSAAKTLARAGEPYSYEVKVNGATPMRFSLPTHPTGMAIDSAGGIVTWTPTAQQVGTHAVNVHAENAYGADDQSFQILVQDPTAAPVITSSPPLEAKAGETYTYQITATGAPAPKFRLISSPPGMRIDSGRGTVIWTPTRAQTGDYSIAVRSFNVAGVDSQRYTLTVYSTPKLQTIGDQNAREGSLFTLTVVADGAPTPTYFLLAPPVGMTLDSTTGILQWTPLSTQVGSHTVFVQARNRVGMQQGSFIISVSPLNAIEETVPRELMLMQSYPNPVRTDRAWVNLALPDGEWYILTLFDATGRRVKLLAAGRVRTAERDVPIDLEGIRSGLYFYVLQTRYGTEHRAMIIAR